MRLQLGLVSLYSKVSTIPKMSCTCASQSALREPKEKCIFCDIVGGRSPDTKVMFQNDRLMIIKDIRPATDYHYLALPKQHIENAKSLVSADRQLVEEMELELRNVLSADHADSAEYSFGFHWPPFTSISHLHMHGMAPVSKMGFLSRLIFKPANLWYCSPQYVLSKLSTGGAQCPIHNS